MYKVFKIFSRKPVEAPRMERVCERCYKNVPQVDRILMTMVADDECERDAWLRG